MPYAFFNTINKNIKTKRNHQEVLFSFYVWEMKKQIGEYRVRICTRPISKKLYNEIHFTGWHNYSVGNGKMDSLIIK